MMKVMRDDGMLENHEIIAGDGRNKKDKDKHGGCPIFLFPNAALSPAAFS